MIRPPTRDSKGRSVAAANVEKRKGVKTFGKVKFKQLSKEDRNNIRQRSKALYEKNEVPENERLDIEDDYTRIFILQDNLSMYPIDVPYNEPYDPNTIFKQGEVLMPPVD